MISILIPTTNPDETADFAHIVEQWFPEAQTIVAHDRYRKGKGWAMREALQYATGDIIVFIDGDGDIHPYMIQRLLKHLDEFDIVVGKKDTRGLFSRWVLTCLSRIYIKLMFGLNVDTQTGVKVFKRAALQDWKCDSFGFSFEILIKAKRMGFSMFEVTVDACASKPMKLRSILKTLVESVKIRMGL